MTGRILGPDGRPVDRRQLTTPIALPTGLAGGRPITSMDPSAGITPGALASLLRQAEDGEPRAYLELAERMEEKDLHYRSVLGTRKQAVAQLEVSVEAASDAADDQRAADLVRAWVARDGLADELVDILDAVGKGFSVCEILWETSAREWRIAGLEWRDPRWFRFDKADGRTILLRETLTGAAPLAPMKFVTHVHRTKSGLPIRGGLAWAAAWGYLFKVYSLKDWVSFLERYGQPMRLGKYGPGATEADRKTLLQAVRDLGSDAAAIVPDSMLIELIEAKGLTGSADGFVQLCNYVDQQVSKLVLGQTTTTDAISGGHAVSKEHQEIREDLERSDARQLASTLNRDIVRPLIDLNMGPRAAYPLIRIGRPEEDDLDAMADRLNKLVPLGLRVAESVVRDKLGLPDPGTDERVLAPRTEPAPVPAPGPEAAPAANGPGATATASTVTAPEADAIDRTLTLLDEGWEPMMAPTVDAILRLAGEVRDLDELRRRLPEIMRVDPGSALVDTLARLGFAARIRAAEDVTAPPDAVDLL